ncbi:DNA-binding HxlR family transcriptional regulator [Thermonema lapsum]|uniref:DNA-binding HxlR family transcriptional regulator n=1 Tax=Thermonema lapsum TaxID=28195 RepID=A0A846MQP2_9BACT|nr:helix-turn-helix domain-containing protein [Thermonema lapsum]NIK73587.1 DNA-binding HxlR family transcriptional regulator [Thermonema lapsum]
MSSKSQLEQVKKCSETFVLAVNDTMNVINGKWKLPIIGSLLYGKKRFKELEREIPKITPRMLSKELKDLELNGIVKRTVYDTKPENFLSGWKGASSSHEPIAIGMDSVSIMYVLQDMLAPCEVLF